MTSAAAENPRVFSPEYYDRLREIEDRHWWSIGMREIELRLLRRHLPPRPLDILDAGCGTGIMLECLETLAGGRPVTGVDLAPEAIEHCRRRGRGRWNVRLGSVTELPFPEGSFDLVHSGDVLQHLPVDGGPERALAESRRVLRPGGALFVRTNAEPSTAGRKGTDYQRFDTTILRGMVEGAGFAVLRISYVNFLPSLWAELRARRRGREAHVHHHGPEDTGLRIRLYPPHLEWLNRTMLALLRAEAWHLASVGGSLPFGHTQVCLARRPA